MRRNQYYHTSPIYGYEGSTYEFSATESEYADGNFAAADVFSYSNSPISSRISTGSPLYPSNTYSSMRLQDQLLTRPDKTHRRSSAGQLTSDHYSYPLLSESQYLEQTVNPYTISPVYSEVDASGCSYFDTNFSTTRLRSFLSISTNESPFLQYIPPIDRNNPRVLLWNATMRRERPIKGFIIPLQFQYPNTVHNNLASLSIETTDTDYCLHLGALWGESFPTYIHDHENTIITTVYPQFSTDTNAQWARCDVRVLLRSMLLRAQSSNQNSWVLQQSECEQRDWIDRYKILYPRRRLLISSWTSMIYRLRVIRISELQEKEDTVNTLRTSQPDTCRGGAVTRFSPQ